MGKISLSKYAVPLMIAGAIIIDLYGKMLDSRAILGFEHNLRKVACATEWSCFSAAVILLWLQGAKISYTVIGRLTLILLFAVFAALQILLV